MWQNLWKPSSSLIKFSLVKLLINVSLYFFIRKNFFFWWRRCVICFFLCLHISLVIFNLLYNGDIIFRSERMVNVVYRNFKGNTRNFWNLLLNFVKYWTSKWNWTSNDLIGKGLTKFLTMLEISLQHWLIILQS